MPGKLCTTVKSLSDEIKVFISIEQSSRFDAKVSFF